MNLEPNNKSLSFAEFLDAAIRDKAEAKPFPYTLEVCRCRYCSFCQNGKCALKRCCCMNERVKARSCTFAELLRDCFANFKDNVFQFRLRIACERATELHTCFLDAGHRARFYEGVSYMRKKDPKFIAQLYLLSASELLWIRAKQVMCSPGFIDYSCLDLKLTEPNAYLYFCTAMDIQYGGSHIDLYELTLVVGLFTEEELNNFAVNEKYGYAFKFERNGDGSSIKIDEKDVITDFKSFVK